VVALLSQSRSRTIRRLVRWTRLFYQALQRDRAFDRAGALAYSTLISLVPLLMLLFAVLDASGLLARDPASVEGLLFGTFLGDIPQVRDFLVPSLEQVDFRTLGLIGTGGLLYVAIRIYMTMERAYCELFKVPVNRTFGQRLINFYLALTAAPVLLTAVILGTHQASSRLGVPWLGELGVAAMPAAVFALAIRLLPCTTVRWGPAWIGGLTSAALVKLGLWAFGLYLGTFADNNPVLILYGSIGVIPIFLVWLYLVWVFVLVGVEIAHFVQEYPSLVRAEREEATRAEHASRVPGPETALRLATEVARRFALGQAPVPLDELAHATHLAEDRAQTVLTILEKMRVVLATPEGWQVARPPSTVTAWEIVRGWRSEMALRPEDPLNELVTGANHGALEVSIATLAGTVAAVDDLVEETATAAEKAP
jgi:membrane protein